MYYVWETVRGQQGSSQGNEGGWQRLGHRGSLGLDLGRQVRGGGGKLPVVGLPCLLVWSQSG